MGKRAKIVLVSFIAVIIVVIVVSIYIEQLGPPPFVVSTSPSKGEFLVSTCPTITLVFSKPMYKSPLAYKALQFTPFIITENLETNWINDTTLEISNLVLDYDERYTVTVSPESSELKDSEGNYLKEEYIWAFSTREYESVNLLEGINKGLFEASFLSFWKSRPYLVLINFTSHADYKIKIDVPIGLFLDSLDDSKCDKIVGKVYAQAFNVGAWGCNTLLTSEIILENHASETYLVHSYSVEFEKDAPEYKEEFSIGNIDADVQKILEAIDFLYHRDGSGDAVQSAIWSLTDDISKQELLHAWPVGPDVSDKQILDAKRLLELVGFETSSKNLFAGDPLVLTAKIQERLELDRVIIYVDEKRETDKISDTEAEEGNRWIIVDVIVRNKMEYYYDMDQGDFVLRNGDNLTEVYECSVDTITLDNPFGGPIDLLPNESRQGEIAFEVPDNVTNLILACYGPRLLIHDYYGEIEMIQSSEPEVKP